MKITLKYHPGHTKPDQGEVKTETIERVSAVDYERPDVLMVYCADGDDAFVHRVDLRWVRTFSVMR
jgi:hypothetical protein